MQQKSKLYGFLAFARDDPCSEIKSRMAVSLIKKVNIFQLFAVLMNIHRLISWFNKNAFYQNSKLRIKM